MAIFKSKSVGIDISDRTIEVVEIEKSGKSIKIKGKNRKSISVGLVENGRIKNEEKLAEILKKLLKEAKPSSITNRRVVFGLPASQIYAFAFETENANKKRLKKAIEEKAERHIPIEKENLVYFYKTLQNKKEADKKNQIEILLLAADKNVLKEWHNFFNRIDIEMEFFDMESSAIFRGLFAKKPEKPICIIDLGARTTNVSIFDNFGLKNTFTVNIAGNRITENIAKTIQKNFEESEEEKIKNGLIGKNKKTTLSIKKDLEKLLNEVNEGLDYFEKKYGEKISEIILVGGSSRLKGLDKFFSQNIKAPVKKAKSEILQKVDLEYLGVIGLAMKNLEKKWFEEEKNFDIRNILKKLEKEDKNKKYETPNETEEIKKNHESQDENNFSETEENESLQRKKLKKQLIVLITLLLAGICLVGVFYLIKSQKTKIAPQELFVDEYKEKQNFSVKIPIATQSDEYTPERIRGRILETEVLEDEKFAIALEFSKVQAQNMLMENEIIWPEPLNYSEEQLDFPAAFRWLAFNESDSDNLIFKKIGEINKNNVKYIINDINKHRVEKTELDYLYYLKVDIEISSNKKINLNP